MSSCQGDDVQAQSNDPQLHEFAQVRVIFGDDLAHPLDRRRGQSVDQSGEQVVRCSPRPAPRAAAPSGRSGSVTANTNHRYVARVRLTSASVGPIRPASSRRSTGRNVRMNSVYDRPRSSRFHADATANRVFRRQFGGANHRARLRRRDLQGDVELLVGSVRRHPQSVVQRSKAQATAVGRAASGGACAGPPER